MNERTLDAVWLVLLAATATMWWIGERAAAAPWVAVVLLVMVAVKGWLVIGEFMALRRVPLVWRLPVQGWLLIVVAAIALAWRGATPT